MRQAPSDACLRLGGMSEEQTAVASCLDRLHRCWDGRSGEVLRVWGQLLEGENIHGACRVLGVRQGSVRSGCGAMWEGGCRSGSIDVTEFQRAMCKLEAPLSDPEALVSEAAPLGITWDRPGCVQAHRWPWKQRWQGGVQGVACSSQGGGVLGGCRSVVSIGGTAGCWSDGAGAGWARHWVGVHSQGHLAAKAFASVSVLV